ncbi:defensin-like [Homalodisca vitripennis]|uniref:defensin-like n=1 Tax=Homalodisca vitripennis TaxID=197043 RepID=UPI001EEC3ADC|nr:defensin-like [Homalodisca vitripennis]
MYFSVSFCLCLVLGAVLIIAVPPEFPLEKQYFEEGVRLPRVTCDLLGFSIGGFSPGHSYCAAHCLALRRGFRGGRCSKGVCHCRK